MASSQAFIEYLQEQLTGCGAGEIYCRKMFGEYGIYCDGVFFGLVCDDQFFVKITEAGKAILGEKCLLFRSKMSDWVGIWRC